MKKAVLASAVVAALVSGSSLAATVYSSDGTELKIGGRAEARFNISDENESTSNSSFEDKSRARVNISGKSELSDGLYGFGKYEAEFTSASTTEVEDVNGEIAEIESESLSNRYYYAGLGTKFGEFSYGKQDSAQVMLTDITDTMATFGADAADAVDGNKDKRENNFLYSGEFDALTVQANYIAANEKDADSFGLAAMYNLGAFDLGAGYVSQKNGNFDDDQINLVAQFSMDAFTVGGLYTMASVADEDYTGYELSAIFKATKQLSLIGVYNYGEFDKAADEEANNFAIEAVYKFNGHIRTYAGYKFEQLDNKDDQLQAGIRYDF
ncbi:Porin, Gram-negative type [Vibrio coralliirubri]|uniref:porin n=1 Tax=Vibrio coralliirubri TaxID=1516159 RepID=UPI000639D166|nr:porin [Vibrio coralliirubri]CDT78708.1 Porin, Gram-negative type [Vibrio coralliirubri]